MKRLLLCDDAPDYRALLRTVLGGQEDFAIAGEAGDGGQCIGCVADVAPDVVLLDVDMPRMGGLEALPQLREKAPDTVVVVLSTVRTPELERRALDLGAAAYVEKPRNVLDLPGLLRDALAAAGEDSAPGEVVERMLRLWLSGDHDAALALFDEEAEFEPLRYAAVHGIAEIERFQERLTPDERAAQITPLVMLERDERVVVLSHTRIAHEHKAIAWVYRVRGSRIAYVKTYGDWTQAQEDAGLADGARERSLGPI